MCTKASGFSRLASTRLYTCTLLIAAADFHANTMASVLRLKSEMQKLVNHKAHKTRCLSPVAYFGVSERVMSA